MKFKQQPNALFMIRPANFGFNGQTAASNSFQQPAQEPDSVRQKALEEFDRMVDLLGSHEIAVRVFDDSSDVIRPDAIFPNNWATLHENGLVVIYPLQAENRRAERRGDIIQSLKSDFQVQEVWDISGEEREGAFLEGTGSIVFDHVNRIGYACRSPRTSQDLFHQLCVKLGYQAVMFDAVDEQGRSIYHTNVMMCIGERFAVICLDAVRSDDDQEVLLAALGKSGHQVVAISYEQMNSFAGNMIEVINVHGDKYVLMSQTAFDSLLPGQINAISRYAEPLPIAIPTIERIGGGSVRCMVAGIHLPPQVFNS